MLYFINSVLVDVIMGKNGKTEHQKLTSLAMTARTDALTALQIMEQIMAA